LSPLSYGINPLKNPWGASYGSYSPKKPVVKATGACNVIRTPSLGDQQRPGPLHSLGYQGRFRSAPRPPPRVGGKMKGGSEITNLIMLEFRKISGSSYL